MTTLNYKVLHLMGVILTFFGIGAILLSAASNANLKKMAKVLAYASHGTGLILILVSGFGLLAHMGTSLGMPVWAYGKLAVWAALGIGIGILRRRSHQTLAVTMFVLALGLTAVYLGIVKPSL